MGWKKGSRSLPPFKYMGWPAIYTGSYLKGLRLQERGKRDEREGKGTRGH